MKKIIKILTVMCICMLSANISLATTEGTLTVSQSSGNTTLIFLVIGIVLIFVILFFGYKMDENSNKEIIATKRNEKMNIQEKKNVEEDIIDEANFFSHENKKDIPYEADFNTYFEEDKKVDSLSLNDEEYEEDDISLFTANQEIESSFEIEDDDIVFEDTIKKDNDFNSTMVFDTNQIKEEIEQEDEQSEDSEVIKNLDERINDLDKIDFFEKEDAEKFMNELKKYEKNMADNFDGFTIDEKKKDVIEENIKDNKQRYTKKKEKSKVDEDFLANMEENMKKDKEARQKK